MTSARRGSRSPSPSFTAIRTTQNRLDPNDLQTKALARWEKQRAVWETTGSSLARRIGTRPNGTTNFGTSLAQTREHIEDFGMIQSAVPQAELSNYYAWEALLRCTDASKAVRSVQIGKAYYPYAIFGEVQDTSSLKPNNPSYSRIVEENQSMNMGSKRRAEAREALRRRIALGDDQEAVEQFMLQEADLSRRRDDYYRSQIIKFSDHIQKKFTHFLIPRQYMEVKGSKTPRMTAKEHDEVAAMEAEHPPEPTQYYPPPQNVRLAAMTPISMTEKSSRFDQANWNATTNVAGVSGNASLAVINEISESSENGMARRVPALSISTRRLLFRGYPGELVHGHIRLKNTSSVTVYYSWMPVDLIHEALRESAASPSSASRQGSPGSPKGAGHPPQLQLPQLAVESTSKPMTPGSTYSENAPNILVGADPVVLQHSRQLHSMSTRCRRAQSYFRLSSPINGVILPDESELFPFSMRAPHEGCFKHTYELLTIPPSPDRILIELCGLVSSAEPTADMLSQPLEEALREKATIDAQRQLVQSLTSTGSPYMDSDIRREMQEIRRKKAAEEQAKTDLRDEQRRRWNTYNMYTYDKIPYHPLVYDKLARLFDNLEKTMRRLDTPLHHRHWDGSLTYLFVDILRLRDAASRQLLFEGFTTLLRLARVSKDLGEQVSLEVLTKAAAEALAQQNLDNAEERIRQEVEFAQFPREPVNAMPVGKTKRGTSAGPRKHTPSGGRDNKDNYVVTGAFRTPAPVVDPEELDLLQAEYDLLLSDQLERMRELASVRKDMVYRQFQHTIDLACDLPLLDVVQSAREKDIYKIQNIDEMEVDNGAEVLPPKLGKGKGRQ